jgi:hypothetical protein
MESKLKDKCGAQTDRSSGLKPPLFCQTVEQINNNRKQPDENQNNSTAITPCNFNKLLDNFSCSEGDN